MSKSRRDLFIDAITHFCNDNSAHKSIKLQMNDDLAKEWQNVRQASGIFGYVDFDEARKAVVGTLEKDE